MGAKFVHDTEGILSAWMTAEINKPVSTNAPKWSETVPEHTPKRSQVVPKTTLNEPLWKENWTVLGRFSKSPKIGSCNPR